MIKLSIDLKKIDQTKCKAHQNGAKYCDIILIERKDNYGNDFMVVQGVSKEERQAGVKGAILGNGKNYATGGQGSTPPPRNTPPPPTAPVDDSDIPF